MKTSGFILSFIFLIIGCTTLNAQDRNKIWEQADSFIINLFKEWNTWLKSGKFEIGKDEHGLYSARWAKWNNPEEYCVAQMKYPPQMLKNDRAGYAVVKFSLDTLGLPRTINILSASHKDFAKETVRLIQELPHCLPCRDKEGKRMECWYTVYVPFLPQQYRNRIKADSIAEKELKQCFVEWETQAQFQGRDGNKVADYIYQHLSYDAKRLDKQQKVKGLYIIKIDSYGEIKEANILQSCGIQEWDEKVVRIIRGMPRWSPAISYYGKGEYKDAVWAIPVIFENR